VRPRALLLLLPLSAADYALWNWSVTGSHDVISLASGMTLLPLAALTLGLLCWTALGLAGWLVRRFSANVRAPARRRRTRRKRPAAHAGSSAGGAPGTEAADEPGAAHGEPVAVSGPPPAPTRRIAA
jgi:hypothetical protein